MGRCAEWSSVWAFEPDGEAGAPTIGVLAGQ